MLKFDSKKKKKILSISFVTKQKKGKKKKKNAIIDAKPLHKKIKIYIDANFNEWNLIHVDMLIANVCPVT